MNKTIEISYEELAAQLAAVREVYGKDSADYHAVSLTMRTILKGNIEEFAIVLNMSKDIKFKED